MKKYVVYGIVFLAMFFWAMTYIWYKIVFTQLGPISVMTIRLLFSAVFMLLFSKITKRLSMIKKEDLPWFLLLSIFQPFLYFLAESHGVELVSPTISAVIISTIPVFTPFATFLFFKDRISVYNTIGIALSFIGVLAVVLGKQLHFSGSVWGIALLFGAVISAVAYGIIIVRLTNKYNSFTIISWQNLFGGLLFLPLFFIFDWQSFLDAQFNREIILNLIYLSLFGSSLAFLLFTFGIKQLGLVQASMFTNIIPVITAIFAYFMLGDTIDIVKGVGIAVVLIGLFMSQQKKV